MLGSRDACPNLQARAYLNHAAIGPLPEVALQAYHAALLAQARDGVSAIAPLAEAADAVRDHAARLTGHPRSHVALTTNTSDGVIAIANSRPADQRARPILLFRGEFPTNTTPWQVAAEAHGAEVRWLDLDGFDDGSGDGLMRVEDALKGGVGLVAVSAVQFQTGLRMPVEALARLCHRYDAALFVDAIQGLGVVPMDLSEADYVTTGGQKWLMGPVGTGFLTVHPRHIKGLTPTFASWLSHEAPFRFLFEGAGHLTYDRPLVEGTARFEGGTRNFPGHVALAASLGIQAQLGAKAIFDHVQDYLDRIEPLFLARGFTSLRATDPHARSTILSLTPPGDRPVAAWVEALGAHGVSVSSPDGRLRLSPSWPNHVRELPMVMAAVDAVLSS